MIQHYVNFDMPGMLFPETETRKVQGTIPSNLRKVPKYTYSISYFDKVVSKSDGRVVQSEPFNKTPRILFGTELSLDQVKEELGENSILYRNLINNGWKSTIKCITGNYQPKLVGDIVLPSYRDLKELTQPIKPIIPSKEGDQTGNKRESEENRGGRE